MHILLTNDDGIDAPGIRALYQAFRTRHQVTMVAPSGERSAASHGVTLKGSLRVTRREDGYAVDGTPADCVKLGLSALAKGADMVVSGINAGANVGLDTHYSGTFSAAMEGAFAGVPALAASCYCRAFHDAGYLASITLRAAETLFAHPLPKGTVLNLNAPNLKAGDPVEYAVCPLGFITYAEEHYERQDGENEDEAFYLPIIGKVYGQTGDNDFQRLHEGKITLTPIQWDSTAYGQMDQARLLQELMKE